MQTSMTYPAPTAAPVTDDRCPPHAWITVGTLTSCSRCGTIDWSAAIPCHLHTEETPMTELAAENAALWALVEAVRDALDLPVPATGGDAQQRYQQVLRERALAVRAVTAHATRTGSAAHSADVLRSETERMPVTYPSIAEEGAE